MFSKWSDLYDVHTWQLTGVRHACIFVCDICDIKDRLSKGVGTKVRWCPVWSRRTRKSSQASRAASTPPGRILVPTGRLRADQDSTRAREQTSRCLSLGAGRLLLSSGARPEALRHHLCQDTPQTLRLVRCSNRMFSGTLGLISERLEKRHKAPTLS